MSKALVVILGAGPPFRGNNPPALVRAGGNRKVLDWIMDAFGKVTDADFHFVGGYKVDEVIRAYPNIYFSVNPTWERSGSLGSLFAAPLVSGQETYICYADVVFRPSTVKAIAESTGDVVIGVDRMWRDRYEGRPAEDVAIAEKVCLQDDQVLSVKSALAPEEADAEFIGLCKFSPTAVSEILSLRETSHDELVVSGLPALFDTLARKGFPITAVDVCGDWAELNNPQDLARFVFGTKGETLERLRPLVRKSVVGDQVRFTLAEWNTCKERVRQRIQRKFGTQQLVIRSSAMTEDGWKSSNAGCFKSILGVEATNERGLIEAVEEVIRSYDDDNPEHQVLVQELLSNVILSGVVLSRSLSHGGPYYVINYDNTQNATDTVTGGHAATLTTTVVYRDQASLVHALDERLAPILSAVQELERLVDFDSLDVEFAMDHDGLVHVFQIRPIVVDHSQFAGSDQDIDTALHEAVAHYRRLGNKLPGYATRPRYFGIMPDWNPAEIVGTKPRRLALSLYRNLITDGIWAQQRAEFGYRDVRPAPLLVTFAGHPYVDIAASLSSFVPASVPERLAERIVDLYMERLQRNPFLHDKIEFEVAITCLTFDFERVAVERLGGAGFRPGEIATLKQGLKAVTWQAFTRYANELRHIERLAARFDEVIAGNFAAIDRAQVLLDDCRCYGTLPFAHLARCAFIGMALLRSLVRIELIDETDISAFLGSLRTVTSQFENDGAKVAVGQLTWDEFVQRYGHLRPGTYEITTACYREDPERYLRPIVHASGRGQPNGVDEWMPSRRHQVNKALNELGLETNVEGFVSFLRAVIEGREYAKFIFTRNLTAALDAFAELGANYGITRDALSHVDVHDLLLLRSVSTLPDLGEWLGRQAVEGEAWYRTSQAIELPPLIFDEQDFFAFRFPEVHPNYVTQKRVLGTLVEFTRGSKVVSLRDHIVLIPQADPGYDWLFGHAIKGLITMYGGANSHMTIRAAEMGLPAAVGIGESLYERFRQAHVVELDCGTRNIRVIR